MERERASQLKIIAVLYQILADLYEILAEIRSQRDFCFRVCNMAARMMTEAERRIDLDHSAPSAFMRSYQCLRTPISVDQ